MWPVVASSTILSPIAWPTPGIGAPVARGVGGGDVERRPGDRVGGAMVGDGLELDLALDLEDVADLVEDPGEVAVGRRPPACLGPVVVASASPASAAGSSSGVGDGVVGLGWQVGLDDAARHDPSGMGSPSYAATTRSRPARLAR